MTRLRALLAQGSLKTATRRTLQFAAHRAITKSTASDWGRQLFASIAAIPLLPLVLVALLASRPLRKWEFVVFSSVGRLSFLVDGLETVLAAARCAEPRTTVVAVPLGAIPNRTLMNLYRKHLWIIGPRLVAIQQALLLVAPWFAVVGIRKVSYPSSDLAANPHVLRGGPGFRAEADRELRRIGAPADQEHVVFSFSDRQYYRQHLSSTMELLHAPRNSDLSALVQPLSDLRLRKISAVRVGLGGCDLSETPLSDLVYDAQRDRSESRELALVDQARFGWSDASGAWWEWVALGIPCVLTSAFSLRFRFHLPRNLIYLPVLWRRADGSLLTFSEALMAGNRLSRRMQVHGQSVERVLPSSAQIGAAFDEALRLPRSRIAECTDSVRVGALRRRLARVFARANQPPNVGIASQFLIDNEHLIDD
jgi:hypothetical protein